MHQYVLQKKQGIASYVMLTLVAVLLLTAISTAIIVYSNKVFTVDDVASIESSLASLANQSGRTFSDIVIVQKDTTHARGALTDSADNTEKNFFAQKIRDEWEIVSVTNRDPSCELFRARGFAEAFIQDCQKTYPDALTVEAAKQTLLQQSSPSFLQIIARVVSFDSYNPTNTEALLTLVSESGTSLDVIVGQSVAGAQSVRVGDTLIVSVISEPNQVIQNATNTQQVGSVVNNNAQNERPTGITITTATSISNVTQAAQALTTIAPVVPVVVPVTTPTPTTGSPQPINNGAVYKLKTYVNNNGELENFFDIDNSNVPIKIEG